jgi:DNA-binding LytR/AlgR family response regulator
MLVNVIFKNKETDKEEMSELYLKTEDIACFYKDKYGTYVTMHSGKSYKVTQTLKELEALS